MLHCLVNALLYGIPINTVHDMHIFKATNTHVSTYLYTFTFPCFVFLLSWCQPSMLKNSSIICLLVLSCSIFALSFALTWLVLYFHPHLKRKTALTTFRPYRIFVCYSSAAIEITKAISSYSPLSCFVLSFCFIFSDLFLLLLLLCYLAQQ